MAPNVVEEKHRDGDDLEEVTHKYVKTDKNYTPQFDVPPLIVHTLLQLSALYGFYLYLFHAQWKTVAWGYFVGILSGVVGVGIGAHRYYSHRSYKATKGMEIALLALQAMAGQNSMYTWARDHRIHHKYSDTDADPHNYSRGFFFAHMGWLITKKHPLVVEKGRQIDVSDLRSNKLLMFQRKHLLPIWLVMGLLIPVLVPMYAWNESFSNSFFVAFCLRYVLVLHSIWSINSVAHALGTKPYDKRIRASQSWLVQLATLGDGWHNFHHSFPWDYRSAEPGQLSLTAYLIDFFARFGLLYDLKSVTPEIMERHVKRHGDGSHEILRDENDPYNISSFAGLINFNSFST